MVGSIGLFVTDQSSLNIPFLVGSLLVTVWYLAAGAVACAVAASLGPERGLVASDVVARLPDAL